jgi:lipid-A-disaccharide synthase
MQALRLLNTTRTLPLWALPRSSKIFLLFLDFCRFAKDIQAYQPDVVILIDYAGFNMRVAKFVKSIGIKTFYYISPKVWAWNQSRALNIKKFVDRMFVIFPFEKTFSKNMITT